MIVPMPRNKRTALKPVDGCSGKSRELHTDKRALVHMMPAPREAAETPTTAQAAGASPRLLPLAR
jgi:hypothetical protein